MSVQQLREPVVTGQVAMARAAVEAAASVPVGSLTDGELSEGLGEVAVLESQVAALKHALLAEADARTVAADAGATGTDAWAARLTGSTRAVMAGGIWLAKQLATRYDATREAFAAGSINTDQVWVIVRAAEKLPAAVTPEQRALAEARLVAKAVAGANPRRLRHQARRMLEEISRTLADEHEAKTLEDEERRAQRETWLRLHDNGDGTYSGRFVIPELHGQLLQAALERLSAPRRWSVNRSGETMADPTVADYGGLNYTERLGTAFCELLEHLPTDGHAANGVTLLVGIDLQHLRDGLAAAKLDTGARISAGQTRRLACEAGIVPQVLGGQSEVLDQGRVKRLHTAAQRRALSREHDACAAEGCERPFAWCEIHHPTAWADGGHTDLDNGIPLCGWHHQRAHDRGYTVKHLPSGEVRFRRTLPRRT